MSYAYKSFEIYLEDHLNEIKRIILPKMNLFLFINDESRINVQSHKLLVLFIDHDPNEDHTNHIMKIKSTNTYLAFKKIRYFYPDPIGTYFAMLTSYHA